MEPDRFLSTSSEGLSATTEIEAPCFYNYGSRTFCQNHEHGRANPVALRLSKERAHVTALPTTEVSAASQKISSEISSREHFFITMSPGF